MQKILLTGALCLMVNGLTAQPWLNEFEGKGRVKLEDVVAARQAQRSTEASGEESDKPLPVGVVKEGKDYHFDRWRWYWERHLDDEGYIVPKSRTFHEWESYKLRTASSSARSKTTAATSSWAFVGPVSSPANGRGLGRIQKITFHPTDSNSFWVGTAGGGAWKTADNGATWTCMTDMLPVLGAADVTYNPRNPNVIYLCTGDRDATDNSSIGVLKSTDGGLTWNKTGFQMDIISSQKTNALLVNPLDTNALLITASTGIYQSRDGGATWTQRTTGSYRDLIYRPGDTAVVYATSANAGQAQIYRSGDGGATWARVTNVLSGPSRVSIAVSDAAPNMVKAIFANSNNGLEGIYHSSDTGKTFTKIFSPINCSQNLLANSPAPNTSSCDGQGWYDLAIAVSPLDTNKVVIGGINTWYSANGGATWQIANQWTGWIPGIKTVHADKHYMAFHPLRPNFFYEGNDGGIYRTNNILSTLWTDITNGMGITQFYRMAVASHSPSVLGGAQDNGSKRINPGAATNELTGGDGMNCELDPNSTSTFYTSIQYGDIYRNANTLISNNIPGQPSGAWITPFALHPRDGARIVAGYDKVYLSYDQGDNWTAIPPTLSSQRISRVTFAPSNLNTMYAVAGNRVRRTMDNGATWSSTFDSVGSSPGGVISDIIVDHHNRERFWITYSGYGANKVAEFSPAMGWQLLNDSLPNVPVNCITVDTTNGTLYIGTDVAVFYKDRTMNHWALWSNNLPAAEVTDLGINYSTGDLWASTYGRGMWRSPKRDAPPTPAGISVVPFAANVITVSPNPSNGSFDIQTTHSGIAGKDATISVLDLTGRVVWSGQQRFSTGGTVHINAAGLPRATYIVDVATVGGTKARTKLIIY